MFNHTARRALKCVRTYRIKYLYALHQNDSLIDNFRAVFFSVRNASQFVLIWTINCELWAKLSCYITDKSVSLFVEIPSLGSTYWIVILTVPLIILLLRTWTCVYWFRVSIDIAQCREKNNSSRHLNLQLLIYSLINGGKNTEKYLCLPLSGDFSLHIPIIESVCCTAFGAYLQLGRQHFAFSTLFLSLSHWLSRLNWTQKN